MGFRIGARRRWRASAGLTVLEVTIALSVISTVLLASAQALSSTISAVKTAQRTSCATVFLSTVMEDISAQSYDDLLAFNGNRIFDQQAAANSNYAVDLRVFVTSIDLRQIEAVLIDLRTNREIARVTTLRSKR